MIIEIERTELKTLKSNHFHKHFDDIICLYVVQDNEMECKQTLCRYLLVTTQRLGTHHL